MSSTTSNATLDALISAETSETDWLKSIPFLAFHVLAVAYVAVAGFSWSGVGLAVALYYVRMFGVTGGYHRYFSHRTFKTSRWFQFVLAFLAMTSVQKGVLWWASHHRIHHKYSDLPGDVHSAKRDGFIWSHVGWILSRKHQGTDLERVRDLTKYPELVFLDRFPLIPPIVYGVALFLLGGTWALGWGLLVSTVLLWHGTFTINSLSHVFGGRRYRTTDDSRNNYLLALITMGEGFHNNHHYYQRATNQGFYWWEFDATYLVIRALSAVGLVWDVHTPPDHVLEANRL